MRLGLMSDCRDLKGRRELTKFKFGANGSVSYGDPFSPSTILELPSSIPHPTFTFQSTSNISTHGKYPFGWFESVQLIDVATAACKALKLPGHRSRLSTSFTNVTRFKFRSHARGHGFESGDSDQDPDARMTATKPSTQIPFDYDSGQQQTLNPACCPLPVPSVGLRCCGRQCHIPGLRSALVHPEC